MIRSRTLETKLRLEIGLYEFMSPASRLDFFNRGRIMADYYLSVRFNGDFPGEPGLACVY